MKTAATNKKIREIIQSVREGTLIPRPEFQRRLVWSRADKNHFLNTVIKGYPFPEIYLADGQVDLDSGEGNQILVDGQQRVATIFQYFEGADDLKLTTVPPYKSLSEEEKKAFLQYDVTVRDLGSITREEIIEVFQRLNATKYSLLDIEVNNAVYAGELKQFAEGVAANTFFERHQVFDARDLKRMGDLRYALTLIITLLGGYCHRDDDFGQFLDRYNDDFPEEQNIGERLTKVFDFIDECNFSPKSRVWRKADLLTLVVELDQAISVHRISLSPLVVVEALEAFYQQIETGGADLTGVPAVYYKAALQASNDRINRVRRGLIVEGLLRQCSPTVIMNDLRSRSLVA